MTKSKNEIAAEIFQALHGSMYFPQHSGLVHDEWQQFKERGIGIIESEIPDLAVYGGFTDDDILPLVKKGGYSLSESKLTELVAHINREFDWSLAHSQIADIIDQYMSEE